MEAYSSEVLDQTALDERGDGADSRRRPGGRRRVSNLRALLAEALHMGDEGHNRNKAGSLLFLKLLAPLVTEAARDAAAAARVLKFLGDTALSVLNPVMAACKAMADAAHGIAGSTVVSTMARNGTDFGIRVSGLGDRWFTAPAQTPDGLYFFRLFLRRCQSGHRRFHHHRDRRHRRFRHGGGTGHRHLHQRQTQGRHSRHLGNVRDHRR